MVGKFWSEKIAWGLSSDELPNYNKAAAKNQMKGTKRVNLKLMPIFTY